jgi:lactate dehydrogenase-like 2-hydroxyacid dehydrogenase
MLQRILRVTTSKAGLAMSPTKPSILYVGQPVFFAHDTFERFQKNFNVLPYDLTSKEEVIKAFAPGGKYATIDGIVRPNLGPNLLPSLDKELVGHLPASCKIVSYCNHGYDGEDTVELEKKGVWYCNGAGGATDATADTALYLILSVFRYTSYCENKLRTLGEADYFAVESVVNEAHDPKGHILGVVGPGSIGAAAAARAKALGMSVHYHSRTRKPELETALGPETVFHQDLNEMLKVADCVLIACPHTPQTHHLLNAETFKLMKKGSRVVNIARGKVIDEDALVDALKTGIISSAGLDVFHEEYVYQILAIVHI